MITPCRSLLLSVFALLTAATAQAQVRITEVNVSTRNVEVTNFGAASVNLTGWRFCHIFTYPSLSGNIAAGESRQFSVTFNQTASDLCLYRAALAGETFSFGDPNFMQDFIQWGAGGQGRQSVAVAKGIWTNSPPASAFFAVPAAGLSFHAKAQPPATGVRNSNWFTGLPHAGFPVPAPELESFAIVGGEWRLIAKSYHLLPALRTEANANLSTVWPVQTPVVADLGLTAGRRRFDIRFPTTGLRQFVRMRADP